VTSPVCSRISQLRRQVPVSHLSSGYHKVARCVEIGQNQAEPSREPGWARGGRCGGGCSWVPALLPPAARDGDGRARGCRGNRRSFPGVPSEPPRGCCRLRWSYDAERRFLACNLIREMVGAKSLEKWRSLLPEDFNFALRVRGVESDVIKRKLEIVQG